MPSSIEAIKQRIKEVVPNDNTISCVQHPNGTVVILVGTAHVSLTSSNLVKKLISHFKPGKIFLELCKNREATLLKDAQRSKNNSGSGNTNVKSSQDLLTTLLTEMQKGTAGKLKVEVGQEFKVAFEEGNKYGAQICLFDRPVGMTLSRFWSSLRTRFEKFLFIQQMVLEFIVTSLLPSSYLNDLIERMTNGGIDIMELIEEMNQHYPTMNQVFLEERNIWMAHCLQASCEDSIADTYVAVVGYAHVHGIAEKFQRPILPICKPLKILSVYNETGEAKYPVLKIDRACLDIPTVQTRSYLSQTHFRIKSLCVRLHFHHTAVAVTGSVYLRTISTKQEVGEVKFGANVDASTPEHMKNNCNAGAIDAICMKQKDDMKKDCYVYRYHPSGGMLCKVHNKNLQHFTLHNKKSCGISNKNGDDTYVASLRSTRTEPLGNKGVNFIEMKLSFDSPIEMRCLYLTAIFDDYDQRQIESGNRIELIGITGSSVASEDYPSCNDKTKLSSSQTIVLDDVDACNGNVYNGPIWGKRKSKTLGAYLLVGALFTSYLLRKWKG